MLASHGEQLVHCGEVVGLLSVAAETKTSHVLHSRPDLLAVVHNPAAVGSDTY